MVDLADLRARIEVELDPATAAVKSFLSVFGGAGQRVTTEAQQMAAAASGLDHALTAAGQAAGQAAGRIADFVPGAHGATNALQQTAQAAEQAGQSMRAVQGHGLSAAGGFDAMASSAHKALGVLAQIGLAAQGIEAIANAAKSAGSFLGVGLASELETVSAKMMAFTKDAGLTADILKWVRAEADKTPFSFREMSDATGALIPVARQARVALTDLTKQAEILAALNPAEGLKGAAFALREAMSGDWTSIIERFNLPRTAINALKAEGVPAMEIITRVMKDMGADMSLVSNMAETSSGKFSTFQDALDGIRLAVGKPLLNELKNQLEAASRWLDQNKVAVQEFAQSLGTNLAGAVQGAVATFQAIAPTLQTMALGISSLRDGFALAPGPIQAVTASVGGLSVALLALSFNPVVAGITLAVGALALLAGKLMETQSEALKTQAAMDAAGGTWNRNTQFATELAKGLAAMSAAGKSNADQVESLRKTHENLSKQWNELSTNFNSNQDALAGVNSRMREVERSAAQFGVTLVKSGDGVTEVRGKVVDINAALAGMSAPLSDATSKSGPFSEVLAKIKKEGTDAAGALDAAMKAMSDFARQQSNTEITLDRQAAAMKAVAAEAKTMGDSMDQASRNKWLERAKGWVEQTGLTREQMNGLGHDLEIVARHGVGWEAALKRIEKAEKDVLKPIESATAAYRADAAAMEASGKEQLSLAGSLETIKGGFNSLIETLLIALGRVPPAMADFVKVTEKGFEIDKDKAEAAGQGGVIALIKGITQKEPVIKSETQAALESAYSAAQVGAGREMALGAEGAATQGVDALTAKLREEHSRVQAAGYEVGYQGGVGIAQGLDATGQMVAASAAALAALVPSAAKEELRERSPSLEMAEIGINAALGLVGGLNKSQSEIIAASAEAFGKVLETARTALELLPQLIDLEVTPDTTAALQRLAVVMRTGMGAVFAEFSAWNAMGVQHVKDVSDAGKSTFDAFAQVVDVVKALADLDTSVAAAEPRIREMARLIEAAMGELFHATVAWNQIGVAHVKEVSEAAKSTFEALSTVMATLDKVRTLPQPNPGDWRRLGDMAVDAAGVMAWLAFNINDRVRRAAAQVKPVNDAVSSTFSAIGSVMETLSKVRTLPEPQAGDWRRLGDMAVDAAGVMAWLAFNINDRIRRAAAQVGPVNDAVSSTFSAVNNVLETLDRVRTLPEPSPADWFRIGDAAGRAVEILQWVVWNTNKKLAEAAPDAGTVLSNAGTVLDTVEKLTGLLEPLRTGRDLTGQDWDRIKDSIHTAIAALVSAINDPAMTQQLRDAAAGAGEVASAAGTVLETVGRLQELMEPLRTGREVNGRDWVLIADGAHVALAALASVMDDPAMTQAMKDGAAKAGEVMGAAGTVIETVSRVLELAEPLRTARARTGDDWPKVADAIRVAIASVASVLADPEMTQELRDGAAAAGSVASAAGTVLDAVGSVLDTLAAVRLARIPDPADVARLAGLIEIGVGALASAVAQASQDLRDGAAGASSVAAAAGAVLESVRAVVDTFRALDTLPTDAINPAQIAAFVTIATHALRQAMAEADDELRAGAEDAGRVAASATQVIGSLKVLAELFDASRTVSPTAGAEMAKALVAQASIIVRAFIDAMPELKASEQRLITEVAPAIQSVTAAVKGVLDLFLMFTSQSTEKTQEASRTSSKGAEDAREWMTDSSRNWERTWTSFDLADRLRAALPAIKLAIHEAVVIQFEILQQFQDEMSAVDRKGLATAAEVANNAKAVQDAIKGAIDLVMGLGDVISQQDGRDAFDKYATALQALRAENARQMEDIDAQLSTAISGGQVEGLAALNRQRERAVQDFASKQAALERQLFADQAKAADAQRNGDPKEKVRRGIENLRAILDQVLTALSQVAADYQGRFAGQQQTFSDMSATVSTITASITGLTNLLASLGDDTTGKAPRIQAGAAALPGLMQATTAALSSIAGIQVPEDLAPAVEAMNGAVGSLTGMVAGFDTAFAPVEGLREKSQAWFDYLDALLQDVADSAHVVETQAHEATDAILAAIAALRETLAALGQLKAAQAAVAAAGIPTSPVPAHPPAPPAVQGFASGVTGFAGGLAMVGERGPELMYLPTGTSISSHDESMSMLRALARGQQGSGGGSTASVTHITVPVVIQGPVYGISDLNAQIQHAVREGVRTGAVRDRAVRRTG